MMRRAASRSAAAPIEERKQATIVFADVCGSTANTSGLDVEQTRDYLAPATRLMRYAAHAYGGKIFRNNGDAVLAVFGAPLGQEDQALRACLAAIDIHRRAAEHDTAGPPLQVRVGINSGEVIVWQDPDSKEDRVDGRSIHLAKRLEEAASPGGVLISASTRRLLGPDVDTQPLGAREVRDFGVQEVFELSPRWQRSAVDPLARRRELGPMLGRERALGALAQVTQQVRAARLRIVGLRGEAGIGKSRIAAEFALRLRAEGFSDHWVCGRSYATHIPYGVIADLLRSLLGVPDSAADDQRDAVREIIRTWPPAQQRHWACIADMLDLGENEESWLALTPSQRQRQIADCVLWLVSERVTRSPLLIVVDDIYLADRESQRLLESLVRRMENMPVLFFATYRQDFVHRWTHAAWFTEHWIGPLSTDDMTGMAAALLGSDASLAPVTEALIDRADGNPFFLEQMAMTLVDDGTLVGAPGFYTCTREGADLKVPASIAAVIGARVDRLSPGAKSALEAAAIVGRPVVGSVIGAMQGIEPWQAEEHLKSAQSSGLVVPVAGAGGQEAWRFEFRHGLVQEAVAAALTRPRRRVLHRLAFHALRDYFGGQTAEQASVLAQHAYNGEEWEQAAEFALKAMARSIARSAYRDALRVFSLGLDASQRLTDKRMSLGSELSLRMKSLGAQLPLGQADDIVANLLRAEAITLELGDTLRQAGVALQLAVVQWTQGNYRQGLEAAQTAAATAMSAGSPSVRMAAMQARMLLHHGLGLYDTALAIARDIEREFAAELGMRQIMPGWAVIATVNLDVFLADVLWRMARFDEAQAACDHAYAELAQHEHAFSRVLVDFVQAEVWLAQGRAAQACTLLKGSLLSCKANDLTTMYPPILATLAGAMSATGQAVEAVSILERAIADQVPLTGGRYNAYYFPKYMAQALAGANRMDEAIASAAKARSEAAQSEQRGHEVDALALQADIEARAGRSRDALAHYEEAMAMARSLGVEIVVRRCRSGMDHLMATRMPVGELVARLDRTYGGTDADER